MAEGLIQDVRVCPRCGRRHDGLSFLPLSGSAIYCGPFKALTHWSMCPKTRDPVLLGKQSFPEYAPDITR